MSARFEAMQTEYLRQRARIEGTAAPEHIQHLGSKPRDRRGTRISADRIQRDALQAVCDIVGQDIWKHGYRSGTNMKGSKRIVKAAQERSGFYALNYKTLRRWIVHCVKYGETQERTRRRRRGQKGWRLSAFTPQDDKVLEAIVDESPQLFLDEISDEFHRRTGRRLADSTIWKRLRVLGFTLQKAIYRTQQASEREQTMFHLRLNENVKNVKQILIILDETHKSRNAISTAPGRNIL